LNTTILHKKMVNRRYKAIEKLLENSNIESYFVLLGVTVLCSFIET